MCYLGSRGRLRPFSFEILLSNNKNISGAGSQRAQSVRRLSARYRRLAGARPRARPAIELSSLCRAARAIADEIAQGTPRSLGLGAPFMHGLVIDGRELQEHRVPVLTSSRAARLLEEDSRGFGATVKRLYLSGQAGAAELRALLEHNESMETDQPESNFGRLAASASGSAAG